MLTQPLLPLRQVFLRDPAVRPVLLTDDQRVQPLHEDLLLGAEVVLLDSSSAFLLLLVGVVVLAVAGGLEFVLGTVGGILIIVVLVVIVVAIDDGDEFLEFLPVFGLAVGDLLIADVE
jgi:hypothetical protein